MVAAIADYIKAWQFPILAVLAVVWTWGGGVLLRRILLPQLPRRRATLGRCMVGAFFAGLAGFLTALILLFLIQTLAGRFGLWLRWIAVGACPAGFLALAWAVLYAQFSLPAGAVMKACIRGLGPMVLVVIVVLVPTGIFTYVSFQRDLDRRHSRHCLWRIQQAVLHHYPKDHPPPSLERMVADDVIGPRFLHARNRRGGRFDYFYLPVRPLEPEVATEKLMACDYLANHDGRGRAFVLANGEVDWAPAEAFEKLLAAEENQAFGIALKKAEAARQAHSE